MRPVRSRLIAALALMAFAMAVLLPASAPRAMEPCAMTAMHDDHHAKNSAPPACPHEMICIVSAALPAVVAPMAQAFTWSQVSYWASVEAFAGLTPAPDPSPPRRPL